MNRYEAILGRKFFEFNVPTKNDFYIKNLLVDFFKNKKVLEDTENNTLKIIINTQKMTELLVNHQICVADICCLDKNSKDCLKSLCLKTCLQNISKT